MRSKRSDYIDVATDDHLDTSMHFFSDGSRTLNLCVTVKQMEDLVKTYKRRQRICGSHKDLKKAGFFVHLNPEVSFFFKGKQK